ncbi:MAG TPA: hypothetical protein VK699_08370 [Terriglobales bacterium]|nr:hypothetical protein [Terriglobales bacterium]
MPKQGKRRQRGFVPNFRIIAIAMIALLLCAGSLSAQRSGGRGGGRGARGAGGSSSGPAADPTEIKDFNRLMAIQATESQTQQFQAVARSTEVATRQAHDLMEQAGNTNASTDFTSQTTALKNAVDDARNWNDYFVKSFSSVQVSGLKEFTKKLAKAESDLVKERSALDHDPPGANLDGKHAAATAERLERALAKFQSEQWNLAEEMGIQRSSPAASP